ncbi:MAG: hypothetical protein Q9184_005129 [Pyrenodesmia sp. 2 TL-2023]
MVCFRALSLGLTIWSSLSAVIEAQSFQRLGTCPTLGCVFPPDQTDFLAGQFFDIRLEVHAPVNGSEATGNPNPDTNFTFTISRDGGRAQPAASYFRLAEPALERWNFTWYEDWWQIDFFARDADTPSLVNVASKAYRRVALYEAGEYTATLTYGNGTKTTASWLVRDLATARKAKNIILFIGYTWTNWTGPDVLLGGGAEQFNPGRRSYRGQDYYKLFADKGYNVVQNNTALSNTPNNAKTLGIFSTSNLPVWLDRNVYKQNLNTKNSPDGRGGNATDVPGLREMTLKAIDILTARHSKEGFFLMSEGASIDKQMHTLDYDRALGDLLELDDTVRATMAKLEQLGNKKETLVLVTADHGHGFDVAGSVDTRYLNEQDVEREKRNAVGTYEESGLSQYVYPGDPEDRSPVQYSEGAAFPANWDPRYTLFSGVSANPDRRENYQVHKSGPRVPTMNTTADQDNYVFNYKDAVTGFVSNGTLPLDAATGVHSLTDVPVFAEGPCQELFGGVYNNIDIFFNMAACLGLARNQAPR